MTKAKKLIEVAMPIKEISTESVRDKYIHHGHISTLHIWWARRPLPLCRAIVFASLVPDPLDENCPKSFRDAVKHLLIADQVSPLCYKPYDDIPYTAIQDSLEDNLRNRLITFIGKLSDKYANDLRTGNNSASRNELLSDFSMIKWENRNDVKILKIARELIWIAYNGENNTKTFDDLHAEFNMAWDNIEKAEVELYSSVDRHIVNAKITKLNENLKSAIKSFQDKMPSVFDPFSGGGAIPLEAARLGCRSFGNDINPVAHIIEKGSAEFPQKYGKPIVYSRGQFEQIYGNQGFRLLEINAITSFADKINIPNRLAFDVEYYARRILEKSEVEIGHIYSVDNNPKPTAFLWARVAKCSNPTCNAEIPLLKQFYVSKKSKKSVYLEPTITDKKISFKVKEGTPKLKEGWVNKKSIICPCCGAVTSMDDVKKQANASPLKEQMLAVVYEGPNGKFYGDAPKGYEHPDISNLKFIPHLKMNKLPDLISGRGWGIDYWDQLFTNRQLLVLNSLINQFNEVKKELSANDYDKALITYLAIWLDRVFSYSTSFARWIPQNEQLTSLFGRQAIPMIMDFPESNLFAASTSSAYNQLDWVINYLREESVTPFSCVFYNASSGEKQQFPPKSITAVVTDPPYYDAIAYADLSDFFYAWMKYTIGDIYPDIFSTPQTPKTEECTALKFHHDNDEKKANSHFENKLTQIFDAIELQTKDIVSIMFAHQSTAAWTTLCNSIIDARMNITGSWPIDSERDTRMNANAGSALESSVTVACRPSERKGFGDYKDVRKAIAKKVEEEVNYLYNLGFRGADLLTACFGQAVSEFGKYQIVEKADGSEVQVSELLEMARESAFDALLKGVQGDDFTRFYVGWLQLNGMGETDFDDVTKFTRVGLNVNITDIFAKKLLIRNGKSQHLATAEEHVGGNQLAGMNPGDILIEQVHRAILLYKAEDRGNLLNQLKRIHAEDITAPFWRLLASLKELLPANDDLKQVQGLLANGDDLRQSCKNYDENKQEQLSFDF